MIKRLILGKELTIKSPALQKFSKSDLFLKTIATYTGQDRMILRVTRFPREWLSGTCDSYILKWSSETGWLGKNWRDHQLSNVTTNTAIDILRNSL